MHCVSTHTHKKNRRSLPRRSHFIKHNGNSTHLFHELFFYTIRVLPALARTRRGANRFLCNIFSLYYSFVITIFLVSDPIGVTNS